MWSQPPSDPPTPGPGWRCAGSVADVPDAEPVLFHGSFVADATYPRGAANAFMVFQLRRATVWIQIAIPLILIPLLSTALDKYSFSFAIAIGVDVLILGATAISWFMRRQRLERQITNSAPAGATREVSMTESSFGIRTGEAISQVPYRQYESAETFGDFVFLRVRGSSIRVIFSRELFTPESLAFFRSKVVGTQPSTEPERV
jgi:hypothetical protein